MTKHIALIALPFVLSILCPQIFAQQKYQLEISTDKSSYEFTTYSSSNISFEVAGKNNNIDQSVLIKQGLQIFPGNKTGEFDLKYTMNRMDMTVKVQSSRSAPLLGLSPLRTVRDTFASYGSSNTRK